jgi:hypothetical protein
LDTVDEALVFGAGFALNSNADPGATFDLSVDPQTGSLRRSDGLEHFSGDFALKLATLADRLLGTLASVEDISDFRSKVVRVAESEDRVKRVDYLRVFRARDDTNAVVVDMTFTAIDDTRHTQEIPIPLASGAAGAGAALP